MLITRSDDGYFGLRQSLTGAFDKAVSSCCDKAFEEHGLTDEGKTVAPISLRLFFQKHFRSSASTPSSVRFITPSLLPDAKSSRHTKKSNVSSTTESENETLDSIFQWRTMFMRNVSDVVMSTARSHRYRNYRKTGLCRSCFHLYTVTGDCRAIEYERLRRSSVAIEKNPSK